MDKKTTIIYILIAIIIFLIAFIIASKYHQIQLEKQQLAFQEGIRQGQLSEQRNALTQIQTTGTYTIPIIDETNQTQLIKLGIIQQAALPENEE
ncbi:MAG: hypothetical protein KKC26_04560 [Nanoarchaeota archaeon]|nr:hypothetical protein [Nanoarchaeota archaeon]